MTNLSNEGVVSNAGAVGAASAMAAKGKSGASGAAGDKTKRTGKIGSGATKLIDLTKFQKSATKSLKNIHFGFNDPVDWIDTGNFCLNQLISGDFFKGVPLGKVTMFAGESGSGKSYICSGNLARNAQEQGCFVVLIDTENALDEDWLQRLGVDTSEDKLMKISASMVDDVARLIADFMDAYNDEYAHLDPKEDYDQFQKVLFIIDSMGMLLTTTQVDQFEKGDLKGDMGRKAQQLGAIIKNTVNRIAPYPIGFVMTNHTFQSQDMFDPDDKIAGGSPLIYASSIVVAIKKKKLKDDSKSVVGIKAAAKINKTRYAKPNEAVNIDIPFETGMDAYSGLDEFLEVKGIIEKSGNRLKYVGNDGKEILKFRKQWTDEDFLQVMQEYDPAKALDAKVDISDDAVPTATSDDLEGEGEVVDPADVPADSSEDKFELK